MIKKQMIFKSQEDNISAERLKKIKIWDGSKWVWSILKMASVPYLIFAASFGANYVGQLGFGDTDNRALPTFLGDSTWIKLSCGSEHTLGIKSDGTLWAWGRNNEGQLGLNDKISRSIQTQMGSDTWKDISAGGNHSLGIKSDGTLWAWGSNRKGQLGLGDTTDRLIPTKVGSSNLWVKIATGWGHSLGLCSNWNGALYSWGHNYYGQLGLNSMTDKTVPTRVPSEWKDISSKEDYTFGIKNDNSLWVWGINREYQLGLNDDVSRYAPVRLGADTWLKAACGRLHSLGIKSDGTLWAWGRNNYYELGTGDRNPRYTPAQIGSDLWKDISCGTHFSIGIKSDGTLWGSGYNFYDKWLGGYPTVGINYGQIFTQIGSDIWSKIYTGWNHNVVLK